MAITPGERSPAPVPAQGIVVDASACEVDDLAPCGGVRVTAAGGEGWTALVERAVAEGWPGLEALPDGPVDVAEAVRGNVAAHGRSVGEQVASVRSWDHELGAQKTFAWADCGFTDGGSRFQELLPGEQGDQLRYEILDVTFLFKEGDLTAPVIDHDLIRLLGIVPGERARLAEVREVLRS